MLTTIQEQVKVRKGGTIILHTHGFRKNTKLSVVAVVEPEEEVNTEKTVFNPRNFHGIGRASKKEIDEYLATTRNEWD